MKTLTTLAATATLIALPTAAFASSTQTAENISVCSAEIMQQLNATPDAANLDFRKVKGNSRLQTLTFRIEADGERDRVTCKVRRDNSVEVVWGEKVRPATTMSVEADGAATAGE